MLENMRQPIAAVRSGETAYRAAKLLRISRSTLERRLENPHSGKSLFPQFEEQTFSSLIKGFEMMKMPLTRSEMFRTATAEAKRKSKIHNL